MNPTLNDTIAAVKAYKTVPIAGVQALVTGIAAQLRAVSGEPDLVLALSRTLNTAFADVSGAADQAGEDLQAQVEQLTAHAGDLEKQLADAKTASDTAAADLQAQLDAATARAAELEKELEAVRSALAPKADAAPPPTEPAAQSTTTEEPKSV